MIKQLQRLKKLGERVINNRENIAEDLRHVSQHLSTIPNIILPLNSDSEVKSELDLRNYQTWQDILAIGFQVVFPSKRESISHGTIRAFPENFDRTHHKAPSDIEADSKWFFINGIATSPPLAMLNTQELAEAFGRPINLIHTPTYGAIWDFWDSVIARTLRKDGHLSRPAYKVIKEALETENKVVLVCHSQGTIISSYIMRKLLRHDDTKELAKRLEIYCIGGVADSMKICPIQSGEENRPVPYVEHFANEGDFFARIGVFAYENDTNGKLFRRAAPGHLLNDHYIGGIIRGEFCGGESRLYKYRKGHQPDAHDYNACPHFANGHI